MDKAKLKNVAVVVVLVAIFGLLGAGKYFGWFEGATSATQSPTTEATSDGSSVIDKVKSTVGIGSANAVNIELPPEPENGVTKGVALLGASGFDSFVVDVDRQGRYKVKSKQFGISLAYEGMTSTTEVKEALRSYIAQMFNKGVDKKNVHFVISSGALKEPATHKIAEEIRTAGFFVNEITPEQEGKFALLAALNPLYKDKAFVVDLGSGNTKIAWLAGNTPRTVEASGSKYFQNKITDADAYSELLGKVKSIPSDKRQFCFVIGGGPYDLAKQHGAKTNRYTPLKDLTSYSYGDDKKAQSTLNILKAIQDGTGTKYIFDADANFSIGFLASIR